MDDSLSCWDRASGTHLKSSCEKLRFGFYFNHPLKKLWIGWIHGAFLGTLLSIQTFSVQKA
jgi:hypothetical protein